MRHRASMRSLPLDEKSHSAKLMHGKGSPAGHQSISRAESGGKRLGRHIDGALVARGGLKFANVKRGARAGLFQRLSSSALVWASSAASRLAARAAKRRNSSISPHQALSGYGE